MSAQTHCEAVKRHYRRNLVAMHARQKAFREANKEKLRAYQAGYRRKKGMKERNFRPPGMERREKKLEGLKKVLTEDAECVGCERKIRKGSDEYFDGMMRDGEFSCGDCGDVFS